MRPNEIPIRECPEGYCKTCWNRWGRSLRGESLPECETSEGACQGLNLNWRGPMRPGETMEELRMIKKRALEEYEERKHKIQPTKKARLSPDGPLF